MGGKSGRKRKRAPSSAVKANRRTAFNTDSTQSADTATTSDNVARATRFVVKEYAAAAKLWGDDNPVQILHQDRVIAQIPVEFVCKMRRPTCSYLKYVISLIVQESGTLSREGKEAADDDPIQAGQYDLNGPESITLKWGPQGKSSARPYDAGNLDGDESTMSGSSQSSTSQNAFHTQLHFRDSCYCMISKEFHDGNIVASHIVPQSRGNKLVEEILGQSLSGLYPIDSVENGLSLSSNWHHMFDRYLCGVYTRNGQYEIHNFGPTTTAAPHGTLLELPFRPELQRKNPRKEFLEWHYTQCVQARLRRHLTFVP